MSRLRHLTYRIGELSALTGCTRDTLRYYERAGLLPRPARTPGGFRVYTDAAIDRLAFIKRAQSVGFSIEEIRNLVTGVTGVTRCRGVRDLVAVKLRAVDVQIDELRAFRRTLTTALRRCDVALVSPGRATCPVVDTSAPPESRRRRQ